VWGWADPGEEVTVRIAGQEVTAKANAEGKWIAHLGKLTEAGPHTLTVSGKKDRLERKDILVGDVWLGSGQSNMAWTVAKSKDFDKEKAAATLPKIRMFKVTSGVAGTPQADCKGVWTVCSPDTVGDFSATAYFFGRELYRELDGRPIGLINSSVGGTAIESWTSDRANKSRAELAPIHERWAKMAREFDPEKAQAKYKVDLEKWTAAAKKARDAGKTPPRRPTVPVRPELNNNHPANLFNGKINPLIPYALKGVIWYQGENNAGQPTADLYRIQLPTLIQDWRTRWMQPDLPFAWVQLPNFETQAKGWPTVREAMRETLRVPNTGMAIAIDIGDPKDIHPVNKQDIGKRLSLWALARVYGKNIPHSGPLLESVTFNQGKAELLFQHANGGLKAKGDLKGFEIAGADGKWHPAEARIAGKDRVIVTNSEVTKPTAVRYLWANNPVATLYNGVDLPASPFRTEGARD
jgi:sialate O-acetylesterase